MKKNIYKKIGKLFSKALAIALIVLLTGVSGFKYQVFADETTIDNSATADTTATTIANTGDNTVSDTPVPTVTPDPPAVITPSDTPTDTPVPTVTPDPLVTPDATDSATTITNTGETTDTNTSSANTGENTVTTTESPTPAPQPETNVTTGNAIAVTNVNTDVNSTSIHSTVFAQTINIYIDQNASLDLSDPAGFIERTIANDPTDPVINLHITSVTNQANVTNTVNSVANTGENIALFTGNAGINTGDAYSIVSVLNRVNFIAIDSVVHVVTINIFGTLNGDIILPTPIAIPATDPCPQCNQTTTITNTATVTNTVDSEANTGNNSITTTGNGTIQTGNATSEVSINNLVNTVLIGDNVFSLTITPIGDWNGNFVGYQSVEPLDTLLSNASFTSLTATNSATVTNTINSFANTGSNMVTACSGVIQTGNAFSSVSLINLVNTVLYRTTAFFGFINIFGTWNGNIGDQQSLAIAEATPQPNADRPLDDAPVQSNESKHDSGGLLTVINSNNVGEYVNPGDTVTFFVNVKNPGNGHVYDTTLSLHLIKDGQDAGGQTFSLGTIDPGHGFKVTTGFLLSQTTPGGVYTAHAIVTGTVGADNNAIVAYADSTFTVSGSSVLGMTTDQSTNGPMMVSGSVPSGPAVLGSATETNATNTLFSLVILILLIPQYIFYRATQNRGLLTGVFTNELNWKARLRAVQTFLL